MAARENGFTRLYRALDELNEAASELGMNAQVEFTDQEASVTIKGAPSERAARFKSGDLRPLNSWDQAPLQALILRMLLNEDRPMSAPELAEATGRSLRSVYPSLRSMLKRGLLTQVESSWPRLYSPAQWQGLGSPPSESELLSAAQ